MVRLYIKQEFMSKQDRLIVSDPKGQEVYLIVGKWGRLADKLSVFAIDGSRLLDVRQVTLSVFPKFQFYVDAKKIGSLKKRPGIRGIKNPFFTLTGLNWVITGDFEKKRFTIRHLGKKIGTIDKNISYLGEFYTVNLVNEEDAPVACAVTVLLDHYAENKELVWKRRQQQKYSLGFMHPIWMRLKQRLLQKEKLD
ncbi:LURP-one-related/scramblase family protein [Alkalibacterium putridalgicola]|uniref:LURP-one-related/scramblase family protein n=1 Tax=Alkalibacterium putridalgicola TaxID=426703 RepID=UPI0034CF8D48